MKKLKVVIICTQNSARSQMAEAFFKKYGEDIIEVYSAGLEPTIVNPYAIRVMQEIGVDISGQRSKGVKEYLGKMSFGYVIAVCKKAEDRCPVIFPGVRTLLAWPFDDPAAVEGSEEEKLQQFRQVRDAIEAKVKDWTIDYRNSI
ncbi:arsenate reductase ArsC [Sporomusa malonica]|uniref:Arsenate reductase n=1 Tax=Sporomusa malonica TaxID=112901 RepID=A0A1W1YFA5_9FIRM|nr:arsenate reductase ArsC [Sporomusa malonica]SMC34822.1 arsenate reductase [Sporomusa malonica]